MRGRMVMDNYNPSEVAQKIMDRIKVEYDGLEKLNVMILGKTGVGKSTLINNMFSKKVAATGVGKPITSVIRKYEVPEFPLAIYDTPGLELSGDHAIEKLLNDAIDVIESNIKTGEISKAIHCIWYCIATPSHRIEQAEIEFLKRFLDETVSFSVPVIVVLTQSYFKEDARQLINEIQRENLAIKQVVPVLAEDKYTDGHLFRAYGLDRLSEIMYYVIPETVKKTFITVQCASIDLKVKKSQRIVAASAATAAGIGAVPIPFSDAALLVPEQTAMITGITVTFGLPVEKSTIMAILTTLIGTAGTTLLGKQVVSGLLKLIPGVGSIVGGTISAGTAAALTAALGETYIAILVKVMKGEMTISDIQTAEGMSEMSKEFKERLSIRRDRKGMPF